MATWELHDIAKRYGHVRALDGVSLVIKPGRIHGLLGENGAGKSTLMNILFGATRPDRGRIARDGQWMMFASSRDAIAAGVGLVHQHFHLVESFTIRENVLLGDVRPDEARLRAAAARLGLADSLNTVVGRLPVGVRQRVEILKALYRQATLLLLDEPTAALTPPEVETLFAFVRELRAAGASVVFITHKLREALELCDTITVLRQGRVTATYGAAEATPDDLAAAMVGGRAAEPATELAAAPGDEIRLRVESLVVESDAGPGVRGASFEVRAGEIFGVAGVDGNGQTELAEALVGLRSASGRVWLDNALAPTGRRARMAAGLHYIPSDRRRAGLALHLSVAENAILGDETSPAWRRWGWRLDGRAIQRHAAALTERFAIRAPGASSPVAALSGGNQQKLLAARELARRPRVLVAVNPTWGVDIAAVAAIHRALRAACAEGLSLVLISNELDEILSLSHRFVVIHRGRLSCALTPDAPLTLIGRLMAGDGPTWERYGATV
ncbi:MAG: ABC transporter ATP-binding protein [Chloracidobacterium sp.]|nr:ABC transporter ATP-binding protein [Chloracidobacterium sp.]MDW8216406.1 ABC transporter ATP-binding protein [Acidobacteriota bacterium]